MATINGTNDGDTLYGTSAGDTISGLNGDDSLKGFGGADRLDGGNGIDTVFYGDSSAGVGINLGTGRGVGGSAEGDRLISIESVFGSNFNDSIIGSSAANRLHGAEGKDVIKGGGGNDYLDGGSGNDVLVAGLGQSVLDGGSGDDTLKGTGGSDTLIGGTGIDTADYSGIGIGVAVSLTTGRASHGYLPPWPNDIPDWAVVDHLSGIENITGSAYGDFLMGDGGVNVLRGMDGEDSLDGRAGADLAYGGTDNDHYHVDNAGDFAWEYAGEGYDTVRATVSYTLTAGSAIERLVPADLQGTAAINLTGNELGNEIWGNYGDNVINGGAGADIMRGWKGNDTYIVDNPGDDVFENGDIYSTPENESEGFDTVLTSVSFDVGLYSEIEVLQATGTADLYLIGSLDNNRIIGNAGNNAILGSYGKDTMSGGAGYDVFVWQSVNEIGWFNLDPDIVTDLNRAEGDLLDFGIIDADETVFGDQDFTFIGTSGFTAPGQINWTTNGTDTFIQLNTNADPTVDGIIQVYGVHTVDAGWFVL
jgi:Ca2+-binding RTX toxin-like protein